MKNLYLTFLILVSCSFTNSCKNNYNSNSKTELNNKKNQVEVIKFMNTVNLYSIDIYEDTFWKYEEEHAKLLIRDIGFVEEIMSIKDTTSSKFENYNYAFLVKKGNIIDTLYSDSTLKSWILKRGKQRTYFYDEKGETAENLRQMYSFFKDCW